MKKYEVTFKFGDVIRTIEAEHEEEARGKADKMLEDGELQVDTKCYDIEFEEIEYCMKCKEEITYYDEKYNNGICRECNEEGEE